MLNLWAKNENPPITVPEKVRKRARRALQIAGGMSSSWVDQSLYLIGSNVTHHRRGDPLLDEAITAAQALLAFLVEMQEMEQQ